MVLLALGSCCLVEDRSLIGTWNLELGPWHLAAGCDVERIWDVLDGS